MKEYLKDHTFLIFYSLGVILFLQHAWVMGFFQDGYLYAAFGKNAAEKGFWLVPRLSQEVYARFYDHTNFTFLLEGIFFKIFGSSFTSARFFAALFSLITGLSLFKFLKNEKRDKLAYLSLLFFFLIPPLMKKGRFPNIDLPLMLFFFTAMVGYWGAYKDGSWKNWLICGTGFGLCALTKGPMAVWVPIIIILHTVFAKSWIKLKDVRPWICFTFGLLLFSLWPLSLYLSGNFDIFQKWFHFTIINSIMEGRGASTPWYTYFVFLLKNTNIVFLLALIGIYKNAKKDKNDFIFFVSIIFGTIILTLSLRGLKYSNYLIPVYPFLAILGAYGLQSISEKAVDRVIIFFKYLVPVTALVLLIFPLTVKSKRDPEIFKTREILKLANMTPRHWVVYKGAYPFWSLANMVGYLDYAGASNITDSSKMRVSKDTIALVRESEVSEFLNNDLVKKNYKKSFFFKKRKIFVFIPKSVNLEKLSF